MPWAARASCWPQPQQLLPASAAGSGRRCCTGAFLPAGLFGGPYELRLPLFLQPLGRALKKRSAAPASPPCFRRRRRSAPLLFESTRPVSLALQQNKNLSVLSYVEVFWWARVDFASRASKKAPQGLFCPPDCTAGRCCSNPPLRVKLKIPDKTKNQRIFYAGLFGGRGWISRAALLKTAHWAVFAPSSATSPQLFESTLESET